MKIKKIEIDKDLPIWKQIKKSQWNQNAMFFPDSLTGKGAIKACLLGWIRLKHGRGQEVLYKAICKAGKIKKHPDLIHYDSTLATWNDDPNRKFSEVKKLLKQAGV